MSTTDRHQRAANQYTLICMATTLMVAALGFLAAIGGTDAEIFFGYIAFLLLIFIVAPVNVLLGGFALFNTWRTGRHLANAWIYAYFALWPVGALVVFVQTGVVEDVGERAASYIQDISNPDAAEFEALVRRNRALHPGERETLRKLASSEAVDVNGRDGSIGFPFLSYPIRYGDLATVEILLEAGADPNARHDKPHGFSGRDSPALEAPSLFAVAGFAHTGDRTGVLRALHEAGAAADPAAMLGACLYDDLEAFDFLLSIGVSIDAVDAKSQSCLHFAASNGAQELVERLLGLGADPSARTKHGATPLDRAVREKQAPVVRLLLDAGASARFPERVLTYAVSSKDVFEAIAGTSGLDVDTAAGEGWASVLRECDAEAVRRMLALGVSPNAGSRAGSPLHMLAGSACVERREILEMLVAAGADLNQRHRGAPPLYAAARNGAGDYVDMLLAAGADIEAQVTKRSAGPDADDPTLLAHLARDSNARSAESAMLLIRAGAKVTPDIIRDLSRTAERRKMPHLQKFLDELAGSKAAR